MILPGFPELTAREPKCKLCQIAESHKGILQLVHRLKHEQEMTNDALAKRIQVVFERHGLEPVHARSVGRHFDNHVDFGKLVTPDAYEFPEEIQVTLERLERDTKALQTASPADVALGHHDSDYHQMADLFMRLQRRIVALDSDPTSFTNADGSHSFSKLKTWSDLIDGARKIIDGLNKMRNSDRMTASILEAHTKRFATAITRPVASQLRTIYTTLEHSNDPAARRAAELLSELLTSGVTTIMLDAAAQSLRDSREEYKLLN